MEYFLRIHLQLAYFFREISSNYRSTEEGRTDAAPIVTRPSRLDTDRKVRTDSPERGRIQLIIIIVVIDVVAQDAHIRVVWGCSVLRQPVGALMSARRRRDGV